MEYWEIIANHSSEAGWSRGCVSAIDSNRQTTWIIGTPESVSFCADEKFTLSLDSNRRFEPSIHRIKRIIGRPFAGDPTLANLNLVPVWIAHICEWKGQRKLSAPYPTTGALGLRDGDLATTVAPRGFPRVLDPAAKYRPADSL